MSGYSSEGILTDEGIRIFEGLPHSQKILYGNVLWDGALSLSKLFAWAAASGSLDVPSLIGSSVIELGAGTGVVALTLAKLGASRVVLTDNEPELLPLMDYNIQQNALSSRASSCLLDWANKSSYISGHFDLVVAADVLYEGDGVHFCDALVAHLSSSQPCAAYVANHHNPDRCQAPRQGHCS
eukprot:TRINITY_DN26005_c0_g1_i2.p1 TRINITY_DN26005_c0_g1~~TRINITY_DN26005_c0_g1_i2.p1  ORF type:complete len:183 (+),score=16.09 TRINITY_DN26005_c0_g1_i2:132-680(+)